MPVLVAQFRDAVLARSLALLAQHGLKLNGEAK